MEYIQKRQTYTCNKDKLSGDKWNKDKIGDWF